MKPETSKTTIHGPAGKIGGRIQGKAGAPAVAMKP